MNIWGSW